MTNSERMTNRITLYLALPGMIALGLWLRWRFIQTVQLYPDEFVTLLAVKMIGEKGLPVMPSGLFYEHGLLFSYLGSLAASVSASPELAVRYASLLPGGLTLVFTFWLGRRWFSTPVGLIAAAGLVIAPAAIQWSGRARMYALLQLLVLATLWLAYQGLVRNKARLRWAALATYLGAALTHFVAVALAPALALAAILFFRLRNDAGEQGSRGAGEQSAELAGGRSLSEPHLGGTVWLEPLAFAAVLVVAFLVKRAGQPKGIEALEASAGGVVAGLVQVFDIYSDFSFNLLAGWQAIAPFYLTLPALIFTPFALLAIVAGLITLARSLKGHKVVFREKRTEETGGAAALFLGLILTVTTLEMILLVSPDRRDDKYLFMLLPVLFLLGGQGMALAGGWLHRRSPISYPASISTATSLAVCLLILLAAWPRSQALLANTGDDYDTAFAYVRDRWQAGDTILTGTPAAAAFYLDRNDFYGVQRRGGYDYRLLTLAGQAQPVDRWLASPAIRTEEALHQTLAGHNVWLVLERWGLQREYYDLPFQQQLLAQTEYVAEAQGIFILRSRPDPRPVALNPDQLVYNVGSEIHPTFGQMVQLTGYTVEPAQPAPGQSPRLTLYWQALAPLPDDYTVFVHLRDPKTGAVVAQADHRPLGSLYPTSLWPAGELIRETSDLPLPAGLSPGAYDLWVGLYLLETGQRLPVENDTSGENAVRLGSLTLDEAQNEAQNQIHSTTK